MQIPCKEIADSIEQYLREEVKMLTDKKQPKLVTVLLGDSSEQLSFVSIKQRLAQTIGVQFEFVHFPDVPPFNDFLQFLKEKSDDSTVTGIIIQHPIPEGYDIQKLYEIIPQSKDIEGHKPGSLFQFPLSLAVLTAIKYIFSEINTSDDLLVDFQKDEQLFKTQLKNKQIVVAGRGSTGGKPISNALTSLGISHEVTHSQTTNPESLYKKADIIITATGKKIITPELLKKDVILLNVGLRKENGNLKGDYDEKEIKEIASYYTPTPGGLGPIDVLYLYKNLIDATKLQLNY